MDVGNDILNKIKENNKSNHYKVIEAIRNIYINEIKNKKDHDEKKIILNVAMAKTLEKYSAEILTFGDSIPNSFFIKTLKSYLEIFKEAEKEMMEADNE